MRQFLQVYFIMNRFQTIRVQRERERERERERDETRIILTRYEYIQKFCTMLQRNARCASKKCTSKKINSLLLSCILFFLISIQTDYKERFNFSIKITFIIKINLISITDSQIYIYQSLNPIPCLSRCASKPTV